MRRQGSARPAAPREPPRPIASLRAREPAPEGSGSGSGSESPELRGSPERPRAAIRVSGEAEQPAVEERDEDESPLNSASGSAPTTPREAVPEDDSGSASETSGNEEGYELYRVRFGDLGEPERAKMTLSDVGGVVGPEAEEGMFSSPARLGYEVAQPAPLAEGSWNEWLTAHIEAKTMPCKRMSVDVLTGIQLLTPQELVDATAKNYDIHPLDTPFWYTQEQNRVTVKQTHERIRLAKKDSLIMSGSVNYDTGAEFRVPCSLVVLRFFDTSGLKMLKRTRLGPDIFVNLDALAIRTMQEAKFFDDYRAGQAFPLLRGSFDFEFENALFFFHFSYSGAKLMMLFDEHLASLLSPSDSMRLSTMHKVVFGESGELVRAPDVKPIAPAHVESSNFSLLKLPADLKVYLLSELDFPDLLSMIRTCRNFHKLFMSHRFTVIASDWFGKLGRFISCQVPSTELLAVWNADSGDNATLITAEKQQFPVLQGATKIAVAFKGYFIPTAMRFKFEGGKKKLQIGVRVTAASMWRGGIAPVFASIVATDGHWFALAETASPECCFFTLQLPKEFKHDVTDVQIKGMSVEMLWAAPWWMFLIMDAKNNVRFAWWKECMRNMAVSHLAFLSVTGDDFMVLGSVLLDERVTKEFKALVLQGVYVAVCASKKHDSSAVSRWLASMMESPMTSAFVGQIICLALRVALNTMDESLHGAVLMALISHPDAVHKGWRSVRKLCEFVDTHSHSAPAFLDYVAAGKHIKKPELTQALDLLCRMMLEGDMVIPGEAFFKIADAASASNCLEIVAPKYCGRMQHGIAQWLTQMTKETSDQKTKHRLLTILDQMRDAKPAGSAKIRSAVFKNVCTLTVTGKDFQDQSYFYCTTCWPEKDKGCCVSCAVNCHNHHALSQIMVGSFYCDCPDAGALVTCVCTK